MFRDFQYYIKTFGVASSLLNLGLWSLILHRAGYAMRGKLAYKICLVWYFYLIIKDLLNLIAKIELPPTCSIGRNLSLVHAYGLVMGNKVKIGDDCTISPWVVIGHNGNPEEQPVIGDNVYIAAHACILGNVNIGNNVLIGANTVVTRDVPSDSIVKAVFDIKPRNTYKTN
jgi:serine acetyltransferase